MLPMPTLGLLLQIGDKCNFYQVTLVAGCTDLPRSYDILAQHIPQCLEYGRRPQMCGLGPSKRTRFTNLNPYLRISVQIQPMTSSQ